MLNLIDSTATNTSVLVAAATPSGVSGSLMLENVIVDSSVAAVSQVPLTSNVSKRPNQSQRNTPLIQ